MSVEVRYIGNHEFAFALPTGYWHAATDDSTITLNGQTTVLRAERDGFRDAMDAWLQMDGDVCGLAFAHHFASLTNDVGNALSQ